MIALDSLSLMQRILLSTDGTVTDLIALYAGEEIHVKKVRQELQLREPPTMLACPGPVPVLRRQILLRGRERCYLHAESQLIFQRFSLSIQRQLLETDLPIGLLWKQERLETFREIIDQAVVQCSDIAPHFALPGDAGFVSRTYVIHHGGAPLGAITEKWPLAWFR
jgi:chorismate-pyruvate lyase